MDRLHCSAGKLLFLAPVFPLPLHSGRQLRIFNLLQCCARDFDVTFVAPKPATTVDGSPIKSLCERVILFDSDAPGIASWKEALRLRFKFGILQSREKLCALSACVGELRSIHLDDYALI
jgi:hypothetical protein